MRVAIDLDDTITARQRRVVNAYDPALCSYVATVRDVLPDGFHVAYSELRADRLR